MKKFTIFFLIFLSCSSNSNVAIPDNSELATTTTSTMPIKLNWDDMYPICTNEYNLDQDGYLVTFSSGINFFSPIYNYLRDNQEEARDFCNENFSYNPVPPELYQYSAKWLEEIYSLNSWMNSTYKMCKKFPNECLPSTSKNFEYEYLTLAPAFEIIHLDTRYLCYLVETSKNENVLTNDRYTRFTNGYYPDVDDAGLPIPINERKRENYILGNQYIRSSIIFPKPVDDQFDERVFSPEFDYSNTYSMTQEPPHFWDCIPSGYDENFNGPLLIKGYGPPFIRGEAVFNNEIISAEGNWVMWSVTKGGPNSTVLELKIIKFYWFNSLPTTLEFCENYVLDEKYLLEKAKLEDSNDILASVIGPENINKNFVNSKYCENRIKYFTFYK